MRIVDVNGVKSVVDVETIDGYFDKWYKIQYYKKPTPTDIFAGKNALNYEFVEKEVDGELSVISM